MAIASTSMKRDRAHGYAPIQIGLHWLIAALVLFQLVFGQSMQTAIHAVEEGASPSTTDAILATGHYWVGTSILILAVLRLLIRLRYGVPAVELGNPILALVAKGTHWLFYILLVVAPVSGLLTYYISPGFAGVHRLSRLAFIGLIGLHAAAALFHHFVLRDGTLKRMLVPAKPTIE
jgi:cytochrome b561